jgi:PAS domain S-box-containing protein
MKKSLIHEAEFLNAVLENAGALVVVLNNEGRIHRFNHACEKLSGYTFAEVEGKYPWETFLPLEDAEAIRTQAFEALAHNPQALAGQYANYWVSKKGERFLTEWSNTLLLDGNGKMAFMVCVGSDITERKRLEQAKRDSESWFQGVFNSMEEAILVVSPDRMLATINPAAERMFGYSADEVKNQSTEIFHVSREGYLEFGARINAAFAKNETANFEYQAKRKNGEIFPTEHRVSLLKNDAGEAMGIVSIVRDITARKQHEALLNTANQILTAVLDTTPVLIAYLDRDMNFVRVNRAYAAAESKVPEYFLGKNHFALYPNVENEVIFRGVAETGIPYTAAAKPFEYGHNPERGVTHWDWTLTPIKEADGKVSGLVLSLLDVTDRIEAMEAVQRSEQELKTLNESLEARVQERTAEVQLQGQRNETIINTALDGFFAVDMSGHIRAANPAFCKMLGYGRDELLQMSISDIDVTESPTEVAAHIERVIANGHDRFDTQHRRKDGGLVDVELSISYVNGSREKMFYAFARDITPRKESEAALVLARDEAERANQAKSEFLSRMSHELRTPMNAILGFSQLLEHENLTPGQLGNVREILHAGRHLLDLINEVLDLSRIEAGRIDLSIEPVEMVLLVNECATMVGPLAAERQISMETSPNVCAEVVVRADRVRLRQILINLLSNAVKYNQEAGRVFIDCQKSDGSIRLSVRDTGKGIPPESMHLLFRPFERLVSPYAGIEGTGIGLVLAKRLAEAMGGKIGVDSQVGVGSVFWVDLPAAD